MPEESKRIAGNQKALASFRNMDQIRDWQLIKSVGIYKFFMVPRAGIEPARN
ncbi:hypothetical protein ACMCNP_03420 [Candidatus Acidulodesulfobacterium sp. H_13]